MHTFLSWPMHTPANHLDDVGVLPEKALDLKLSDLLGSGQRAAGSGQRAAGSGQRAVRGAFARKPNFKSWAAFWVPGWFLDLRTEKGGGPFLSGMAPVFQVRAPFSKSRWIASMAKAGSSLPSIPHRATSTRRLSPPLSRNGNTAPSTAWTTIRSASGERRPV